jgi:hypothetical protein
MSWRASNGNEAKRKLCPLVTEGYITERLTNVSGIQRLAAGSDIVSYGILNG